MTPLEWTSIGSGASIAMLALLFSIERARGSRLAAPVRQRLDTITDWCIVRWHTIMLYIGSGAARVGLHYVLHRILRGTLYLLDALRSRTQRWQRRNRRIARTVQAARAESHLTAITQHKHATALSDSEKEALKEKSITG